MRGGTERFKLIHFYQFDEWELYDLETVLGELRSQYDNPAYAAEVALMKGKLEAPGRIMPTTEISPRSRTRGVMKSSRC